MPEDCFVYDSQKLHRTEDDLRLADQIFSLQTMNRDTQETAKIEADQIKEPDWDGNVPPDLSDGFDFLL